MSMIEQMLKHRLREVVTDKFVIDLNMPKDYPAIDAPITEEGGVRERFFKSVAELPDEITVVHPFSTNGFPEATAKSVYVAPDGCDKAEGTKESPLATLGAAVERVRGMGGAKIILRGGRYNINETVKLTSEHSGTESCPLIITAEEGETPYISSCVQIPYSAFKPLADEAVISRLKDSAKGRVLVCDLTELGLTEFGRIKAFGGMSFAVNGKPQKFARYPKEGCDEIVMGELIRDGWDKEAHKPCGTWEVALTDDRPTEWEWNDSIYLYGSLSSEWNRHYGRLSGIDREKKTFYSEYPFERWPSTYSPSNSFYFANVIEELENDGECCIDFNTGKIYYIPCADFTEDALISYAYEACNLIECNGVNNVIIDRLDLGRNCGSAITVRNCRQVLIQRCHFIGTAAAGREGNEVFSISDGFRNGIIDCVIEYFACHAGSVSGGDRKNLIPANNFLQNCKIINPLMRFGISSGGCGNIVSHNYTHNTTMGDCGHNEGIVEYNIIEGGDTEANDTGMIYVGGGGCSSCANHYRYNYFFDFAEGDYGIYFDDLSRGMYAYGNIVVGNGTTGDGTTWKSGGRSFNHHNGGEHCYWNNISIDAGYFAFGGDITYWNTSWGHWSGFFEGIYHAAKNMSESQKYMDRNPTYKDYVKAVFQHKADRDVPGYEEKSGWAERRLRANWCNHYENNLILRAARPFKLDIGLETATGLETNYITSEDVGFVDEANRDYRLKPDSIVFEKIPGFIAPPFEKMGPVNEMDD